MTEVMVEFADIIGDVHEHVQGDKLGNWAELVWDGSIPLVIQNLLPPGIGFRFLPNANDELLLYFQMNKISSVKHADDDRYWVSGTLDASADPNFKSLFELHQWRTVIFTLMNEYYESLPGGSKKGGDGFVAILPLVIYSKEPAAFDPESFRKIVTAIFISSAMLLIKFGLTYIANKSERMWSSVPGILLVVSHDTIYQINDKYKEWFELPEGSELPLPLEKVLPEEVYSWIRSVIVKKTPDDKSEQSQSFWLMDKSGSQRRMALTIRSYKPFEHLTTRDDMVSGFQGITMSESNRVLQLLAMRDVTAQWEAERMQQQFEVARHMQNALRPKQLPRSYVYDIAAICLPAYHVGGDLYDVVQLADGRIALLLGDASGHGVDSALLAALISGAFRAVLSRNPDVKAVISALDLTLRSKSRPGFVTAIYMLFEKNGKRVQYALAGHPAPMILNAKKDKFFMPVPSSLPLGVNLPPKYFIGVHTLHPNDIVTVFSDGLLETRNNDEVLFETLIPDLIMKNRQTSASAILDHIVTRLDSFRDKKPQEDDLTAMIVRVNHVNSY